MTGETASASFDIGAALLLIKDAQRDPRAKLPPEITAAVYRLERAQRTLDTLQKDTQQ